MVYNKLNIFLSSGILAGVWANFFYQVNSLQPENLLPDNKTMNTTMEEMNKISHIVL